MIWFWLRRRPIPPGETFVWYVAAYGVFRFLVEFVRGNEVVWHGLTRPQLFLAVTIPFVLLRILLARAVGRLQPRPAESIEERVHAVSTRRGPGMPLRGDRIHRYVNAFCPLCHEEQPDRPLAEVQRLSGWLVEREDRIWLERGCATHGLVRTLYDESPEILTYLEQWTAPTKVHSPDLAGNFAPVPAAYADGLPEMQTQHTCILLEDLLDHCNLKCPTCFAASAPALASVVPLEQVLASIDTRLSRENGRIDVLMLSGGEPTLYPWLAELLDAVAERPIVRVLVNSNGLAIAQDDALLATLQRHRERVEVYLQYDGESAEASTHHRGADIRRFKERAIERLSGAGVFTTLTMTAALGVNDDEIGFVIKRALDTPYVGGVTIQPVFGSGRSAGLDPMDRLTHTGVLARLDEQTAGQVTWRDLTALPCSHPHCCSVGLPAPRRLRILEVAGRR